MFGKCEMCGVHEAATVTAYMDLHGTGPRETEAVI